MAHPRYKSVGPCSNSGTQSGRPSEPHLEHIPGAATIENNAFADGLAVRLYNGTRHTLRCESGNYCYKHAHAPRQLRLRHCRPLRSRQTTQYLTPGHVTHAGLHMSNGAPILAMHMRIARTYKSAAAGAARRGPRSSTWQSAPLDTKLACPANYRKRNYRAFGKIKIDFPFCPKDTEQVKRLCQSTERYERQRRNLTHTRNAAERQRI